MNFVLRVKYKYTLALLETDRLQLLDDHDHRSQAVT